MIGKLEIKLKNDLSELKEMNDLLALISHKFKISIDLISPITLAIEEALVNVINYAYPKGTPGEIILSCEIEKEKLTFTLTDSGEPFDPTKAENVDTSLGIEDRPIGGLGIFLIRQIMDDMVYIRENNNNVLKLTKYLKN